MINGRLTQVVGETVRVYYNGDNQPVVTGKLIAICPDPVLIIEDADGQRHYHASTLRLEVEHTEWRPV